MAAGLPNLGVLRIARPDASVRCSASFEHRYAEACADSARSISATFSDRDNNRSGLKAQLVPSLLGSGGEVADHELGARAEVAAAGANYGIHRAWGRGHSARRYR